MKYYKKLQLLFIVALGIVIYSCQNEDDFLDQNIEKSSELIKKDEKFKDGKKLKNPYTLKNMQKALDNIKKKLVTKEIKAKGISSQRIEESIEDFELNTSHYYVLLKPQNAEEENLMKEDSTINVFDYPLDYEFTDEYLDNRTPDSDSIPEYYTSVPLGTQLPNIAYEILEELYIPEEDPFFDKFDTTSGTLPETRQGEISNHEDLLRHLLMEAYTLTDNEGELLPEGDTSNSFWIFGNKWYPSGTLKIWDDNAGSSTATTKTFSHWEYYNCETGEIVPNPNDPPNPLKTNERIDPIDENICQRAVYTYTTNNVEGKYVPLGGAKVLMRQWFTIRKGITDQNGNFRTGSVRGNARYIIQWERHHYSIRSGWFGQAETRGPKENDEAWNHNIKSGKAEYYGHIHRAAHNYFYSNIDGLKRPPKNGFLKSQIKIAAYDTYDSDNSGRNDHYARLLNWLTPMTGILQAWPTISLKLYERPSTQIFGTTTHELAHSTHAKHAGPLTFIGSEKRMIETYAQTIEWHLTTKYYKKYRSDFIFESNYQNFSPSSRPKYTSLMVDLIDNENQPYLIDRVYGYTIQQIETEVHRNKTFLQLKNDLRNRYYNSTEMYLDELFNNWN